MTDHELQEAHRRALDTVSAMSLDEQVELLQAAGVLGADGHLAERFRPEPDQPTPGAGVNLEVLPDSPQR